MKNIKFRLGFGHAFVMRNGVTQLVPSMVLSTLVVAIVITFVPQLVPLMMAEVQRSPV